MQETDQEGDATVCEKFNTIINGHTSLLNASSQLHCIQKVAASLPVHQLKEQGVFTLFSGKVIRRVFCSSGGQSSGGLTASLLSQMLR